MLNNRITAHDIRANSPNSTFHIWVLSILCMAVFMNSTAETAGPMAPLIALGSIYLFMFGVLAEALLLLNLFLFCGIGYVANRINARRATRDSAVMNQSEHPANHHLGSDTQRNSAVMGQPE